MTALTAWDFSNIQEAREQAEREARHAQQVSDFLIETFAAANPQVTGVPEVTVKQVLGDRLEHVNTALSEQPDTQVRLLRTMALALQKLGEFEQSEATARQAISVIGDDPSLRAEHLYNAQSILISVLFETAQLDNIEPLIVQHSADTEAIYGADSEQAIMAANRLATLDFYRGDLEAAASSVSELLRRAQRVMGPAHHQTLLLAGNLVAFYYHGGQIDEALAVAETNYETASAALPADNQQVLALLTNLASVYNERGDHQLALERYTDYRDRVIRQFGEDHVNVVNAQRGIGTSLAFLGRHEEAAEVQRELIRQQTLHLGAQHPETLSTRGNYANTLSELGRHDEALIEVDLALDGLLDQFDEGHYHVLFARVVKSQALAGLGDPGTQAYIDATYRLIVDNLGASHYYLGSLKEIAASFSYATPDGGTAVPSVN